jgi:hypothetical protein
MRRWRSASRRRRRASPFGAVTAAAAHVAAGRRRTFAEVRANVTHPPDRRGLGDEIDSAEFEGKERLLAPWW